MTPFEKEVKAMLAPENIRLTLATIENELASRAKPVELPPVVYTDNVIPFRKRG